MTPRIENAPGIAWKPMKNRWEARWQARTDLVLRGYRPKSQRVWVGNDPTPAQIAFIQDRANRLQSEMLVWARGGIEKLATFDGTLGALIQAYQTDPDSTFHKARFVSRKYYTSLLSKIIEEHGDTPISDIKVRTIQRWHEDWSADGKVAMGHATVGMLRTVINFGLTLLEDEQCSRLSTALSKMKFKMAKPRTERLTAEMAIMIRNRAHFKGLHSIALAQAIQFDGILRQKDVLGEWVPLSEPGTSEIVYGNTKWLRGIRWNEIDENLILSHVTSKRNKLVTVPLSIAPMVMEELSLIQRKWAGPVIVFENSGLPWAANYFRQRWRELARECGIPDTVRNMDSRAGAISEATDAGASLEHIRQAATHSDISMTQRYSRGDAEKTANVLRIRAEHRSKTK